ncbi:hypothetical protein HAX54_006320, partial [Datura stramonium]|nr:hypothetical protein [Datura stramonium]
SRLFISKPAARSGMGLEVLDGDNSSLARAAACDGATTTGLELLDLAPGRQIYSPLVGDCYLRLAVVNDSSICCSHSWVRSGSSPTSAAAPVDSKRIADDGRSKKK